MHTVYILSAGMNSGWVFSYFVEMKWLCRVLHVLHSSHGYDLDDFDFLTVSKTHKKPFPGNKLRNIYIIIVGCGQLVSHLKAYARALGGYEPDYRQISS